MKNSKFQVGLWDQIYWSLKEQAPGLCNQALRTWQSHMNLKGGWGHTQNVQCFVNYQNDLKTHVSCGKKSVALHDLSQIMMVSHKTAKTSFLSTTCKFNHPQVKEASISNTERNFKLSESTYIKSWCAHLQHECSINHIWDCHSSSNTSIHHQPKTMTSSFKPTISNTKITFTSTLLTMTVTSGKNGSLLQQNLLNLIHYHCVQSQNNSYS